MAGAAKKFNLTELLNQRSKEAGEQQKTEQQQAAAGAEVVTSEEGVSSTADIYDLIPSKGNFYSVEDVQDLKQSIELLGVLQPLLVTDEEEDGKRRIIAGHRRRLAVMQLVDEGKERFRRVPILIKPKKNAILDRLALIMANRFREKTDSEIATEMFETVTKKLLNDYGLKTLAKGEPFYKEVYEGDVLKRDMSYHQGITWPWLLGIYSDAYRNRIKAEKNAKVKNELKKQYENFRENVKQTFIKEMNENSTVGSISELYDSKKPYLAKGAFAQAWSVSEIFKIILQKG